jgi:hypothetical protein
MAVVLRKPQQPASPSATSRIETTQAALEQANAKLAELNEQRNAALLRDDNGAAVAFGIEITNLKLTARAHEDKITLLREAAVEGERERKVKEKAALIERIEKKLAGRDSAGAELADAIAKADKAYRKLIDIGLEVTAAWSWPPSDLPACLLSHGAITAALTHEMYRIGGRPMLGGGQVEAPHAGMHFPGAKVPRVELTHLREKIVPFTAVLQQATAHASNIMRGARPSAPADFAVSAPAPARNGGEQIGSGDSKTRGVEDAPRRIDAERKLGALLRQQALLAEDTTPEGEREYQSVVAEIAKLQDVISAEKRVEMQHG